MTQDEETTKPAPAEYQAAITIYNLMGGRIDWSSLELLCEYVGTQDIESVIQQLVIIDRYRRADG